MFRVIFRNLAIASVALVLIGCSGSGGGGTTTPTTPTTPATVGITGTVTFDSVPFGSTDGGLNYNNISQKPVKSVPVQLVTPVGALVAQTVTDSAGGFAFDNLSQNTDVLIQVVSQLVPASGSAYDISVVDNTQQFTEYSLVTDTFNTGTTNQIININAPYGNDLDDTELRPAGPFAILDSIYTSVEAILAVDPGATLPALEVWWSVNNRPDTTGGDQGGGIGTSFYSRDANNLPYLAVLGQEGTDTDEYDTHVIVHEFGHYLEDNISRSDSFGGSHSGGEALDLRVAFSEGFATALSGIILEGNVYQDSAGPRQGFLGVEVNLEDNNYSPAGWFNEGSIGSVVYDVFDTAGDSGDSIAAGFGPIYRAMISDGFKNTPTSTSIFSWAAAVAAQPEVDPAALLGLLQSRGINSIAADATGETNDGGAPNVLPVYRQLTTDGVSQSLCSINDFGTPNKLGVFSNALMTPTANSGYVFNIDVASGSQNGQPIVFIVKNGEFIGGWAPTDASNSVTFIQILEAGETYLLFLLNDSNLQDPGVSTCYDVTVQGAN